jgi:hypothetical protein
MRSERDLAWLAHEWAIRVQLICAESRSRVLEAENVIEQSRQILSARSIRDFEPPESPR